MIPPLTLQLEQAERLRKANQLRKFGHLATWKELFIFQCTVATPEQIQMISGYAYRKNHGEPITLPLKDYAIQQKLLTS
jgi:hypothetical protein